MPRDILGSFHRPEQSTPRGPGLLEKGGFFDRLIHRDRTGGADEQRTRMPESRVQEDKRESSRSGNGATNYTAETATAADRVKAYFKLVQAEYSSAAWRGMSSDQKYNAAVRHLTRTGQIDDFRAAIAERDHGVKQGNDGTCPANDPRSNTSGNIFESKQFNIVVADYRRSSAATINPDRTVTMEAEGKRFSLLGIPLFRTVRDHPGTDGASATRTSIAFIPVVHKGERTANVEMIGDNLASMKTRRGIDLSGIKDALFRRPEHRDEPAGCCGGSSPAQSLDPKEQVRTFYRETRAGYSASAWAKLSDEKKFEAVEAKYGKAFVDAVRNRDAAARRAN